MRKIGNEAKQSMKKTLKMELKQSNIENLIQKVAKNQKSKI